MTNRSLSSRMKDALLCWFNVLGKGYGLKDENELISLFYSHIPSLLNSLRSKTQKAVHEDSLSKSFEDAASFFKSKEDLASMPEDLSSEAATKGDSIEIAKFLLLFWYELSISQKDTIIELINERGFEEEMARSIAHISAAEHGDVPWWEVLLDEDKENKTMITSPASTPPRLGEENFCFTTPSLPPARYSFCLDSLASYQSLSTTPRNILARRKINIAASEPRTAQVAQSPLKSSPLNDQIHSPALREKRRERELRQMKTRLDEVQEDRDQKELEIMLLKKQLDEMNSNKSRFNHRMDELTSDLRLTNNVLQKREEEVEKLSRERNGLVENIHSLDGKLKRSRVEKETAEKELEELKERMEEGQKEWKEMKNKLIDSNDELLGKMQDLNSIRSSLNDTQRRLKEKEGEYMQLKECMDSSMKEVKKEKERLEEDIAMERQEEHETKGRLNGIIMERENELSEEKEKWMRKEKIMIAEGDRMRKMMEALQKEKESFNEIEGERKRREDDWIERKNQMEEQISTAHIELIRMQTELTKAMSKGEEVGRECKVASKERDSALLMVQTLEKSIDDLREEMRTAIQERESALVSVQSLEGSLNELRNEMNAKLCEKEERTYDLMLDQEKFVARISELEKGKEEREEQLSKILWEKEEFEKELLHAKGLLTDYAMIKEELKNVKFVSRADKKNMVDLKRNAERLTEENEELKLKVKSALAEMESMRSNGKNLISTNNRLKGELNEEKIRREKAESELELRRKEDEKDNSQTSTKGVLDWTSQRNAKQKNNGLLDFDNEPEQLYGKSLIGSAYNHEVLPSVSMSCVDEESEKENCDMTCTPSRTVDSMGRIEELAMRNKKSRPHLQSTYAAETAQYSPDISEGKFRGGEINNSKKKHGRGISKFSRKVSGVMKGK